ncbi:MAG: TonB-dependent receptor, partial [Verrucomicrobia bacterium]|nr:TonB-dependent receptor [Verrucomicrobiota bacterium]
WIRGSHNFKFGGTLMQRDLQFERTQFGKGFYFFSDQTSPSPGHTGYEVADMLVAKTAFTATGVPGYVPRETKSWENSIFVQDDWRVDRKLTLNLGLRYDLFTPYYEVDDKLANYDPATQSLVLASRAYAAIAGRDFVTPDDMKEMAKAVLEHRLILRPEFELEGLSPGEIIDRILQTVAVPR